MYDIEKVLCTIIKITLSKLNLARESFCDLSFSLWSRHILFPLLSYILAATTVSKKSTTRLKFSIGYDNTSSTDTSSQLLQWHFQCKREGALKIGNSFTEIKLRKFSSSFPDSYFRSRRGEYVSEQQCEAGKYQFGSEQQQQHKHEQQNFVNDDVKLCQLETRLHFPSAYTLHFWGGFATMDEEGCWKMWEDHIVSISIINCFQWKSNNRIWISNKADLWELYESIYEQQPLLFRHELDYRRTMALNYNSIILCCCVYFTSNNNNWITLQVYERDIEIEIVTGLSSCEKRETACYILCVMNWWTSHSYTTRLKDEKQQYQQLH